MRTRTRDTSQYGLDYISGLLRMKTKRNINNIARTVGVPEQNMQQFISDSPWSGNDELMAEMNQQSTMPNRNENADTLATLPATPAPPQSQETS